MCSGLRFEFSWNYCSTLFYSACCSVPSRPRPLPTPSSWSTKPAGTCPRASSCRPISPSLCCRRSAQSSTRSRTSGSSCATTGSPTASSNPTMISSTIVVRHGTSSSTSLGASCPSDCANGPTGSDQWDLVLANLGARDGFLLDGGGSSAMGIGQGSTGTPATVLLGGGRPVATYIGVRAPPCSSPVSIGFCD